MIRWVRRPRREDRGVNSLELALLTPLLLTVMLFVVQFAMVYHARHVALAAAQAGARVARSDAGTGWELRSRSKAHNYIRQIGPRLLTAPRISAREERGQRVVEVSGHAVEIIPLVPFRVSERSGGPVECFRPDVGTGDACARADP